MQPTKPLMLEVPDAEERDEFLANARKVWNERHPDKQKEAGKPGDDRIIPVLKEVLLSWPKKSPPSIKHLTKLVAKKFEDKTYLAEKFPQDLHPAASDTIRRYAKLTLIFMKWAKEDTQRNINDVEWVSGNVPASHEAISEILEIVSSIMPDVSRAIECLNNIPRIVQESGMIMTAPRTRSLQRAVQAFLSSLPETADK